MLNNLQTAAIPETVQNIGMIPLAQWNKYFAYMINQLFPEENIKL